MKRIAFAAALALALAVPAFAQKDQNSELGFHAGKLYDFSEVDSINLYNGNLMLTVPLGPKYQVSSKLGYQFTLVYNGKMWDYENYTCLGGPTQCTCTTNCTNAFPNRRSNAGAGWRVSFGRLLPPYDPSLFHSSDKRDLWVYEGPTGDEHAFVGGPQTWQAADDSALRLLYVSDSVRKVEFPNGEVHQFERSGNEWRLRQMSDLFGNWVLFTYTPDPQDSHRVSALTITDSVGRRHDVTFTHYSDMNDSVDRGQNIQFIRMQGANGAVAPYEFQYQVPSIHLVGDTRLGKRARVPVLQNVKQPDGSLFGLDYYTDPSSDEKLRQGAVSQIHLPTGGSIEYHYQSFFLPTKLPCPGAISPEDAGIRSRTISDGSPSTKRVWNYVQGLGPVVPHELPPGDLCGSGIPALVPVGPFYWSRTTVLEPSELRADGTTTRTRTDHYFDAYSQNHPQYGFACPNPSNANGFCPGFGYPGSRGIPPADAAKKAPFSTFDLNAPADLPGTDSAGRRITTQLFTGCDDVGDCTRGELKRSTYSLYEQHPLSVKHTTYPLGEGEVDPSLHVKSTKTVYHDDQGCSGSDCYVESNSSDDNGAGLYRQVETDSNFPGSKKVTARTEYAAFDPSTVGEPWITSFFSETTRQEEGSAKLRQLSCVDSTNGFLKWQRVLKDPAKLSKDDVLAVFEKSDQGDVEFVKYYGGDKQPVLGEGALTSPVSDVCSIAVPGDKPWYMLENHYKTKLLSGGNDEYYTGGIPAWSRYYDRDKNGPFGFLSLDRTIDRYTGAVLEDRDTAGIGTRYSYDSLPMRLVGVQPPGGASSSYQYFNATPFKDAYVIETIAGVGTNTYEFDGLGRVKRVSKALPNGKVSVVQTDYDGRGRTSQVSQPVQRDVHPFESVGDDWTKFKYDDLDRKIQVTAPDGATTSFDYTGVRKVVHTNTIATSSGGGESPVQVTETYDYQERLIQVDEYAGDTSASRTKGDLVTTTYAYHTNGKPVKVEVKHGTESQPRTFVYDNRGFLDKETQPESGETDYNDYDARGHSWKRVEGGKTVDSTYDFAERLTSIAGATGPIKEFKFGETDHLDNGKLYQAIRHNVRQGAGNVDVKETYSYSSANGLMTQRTTLVERVVKNPDNTETRTPIQEFSYGVDYDSLLLPRTISMPRCSYYGCSVDQGLQTVTNTRTAGYLTSVKDFADLTYHPSGMVDSVRHKTLNAPTDVYSERFGMPRPSKITFAGCTNTKPFFLPGLVRAKVDPTACGIQVTWPAATLCGGASNNKYRVLRDGVDITGPSCLTGTKFIDRTAVKGNTYKYTIVAEGPAVDGGAGTCQGGETVEIAGKPFEFKSCDSETLLTVNSVRAAIGVASRFQASLGSANGPLPDEELTFSVLGKVIGTARTGTDGIAVLDRIIDVAPGTYVGGISVMYAGGLFPAKTVTADFGISCEKDSYGVKPLAYNVPAAGGNYPVVVITSTQCSWTPGPAILHTFISVNPQATQKGIGKFDIVVPSAEGAGSRSSAVDVAEHLVRVEQSSGCTFRFTPDLAYIPYKNGLTSSIDISATEGCAWSVTSNASWLHLTRSSGTGSGYISFTADRNNGSQRVAVLSLNDGVETARVNQYAPPPVVCPTLVDDLTVASSSVRDGQYISMRVNVEGTYLEYQWWINGRPIGTCDDDRCAARMIGPGDEGYPAPGESSTFQVVVSNSCDTVVSREVHVTNSGNTNGCKVPTITDSLYYNWAPGDAASSFPGYPIHFYVVSFGGPGGDPAYQWYRGFAGDRTDPVPDVDGGKTNEATVRPGRTSFYWVEVTNSCGPNFSRTAAVYITAPPRVRRRAVSKDFTGDGKADLVWHNVSTGQNEIWPMNVDTQSAPTITLPASTAQIQSVGDLNDDQLPELIVRDPQTGKNDMWTMRYSNFLGSTPLETRPDGRWSIGGVADLDNDFHDDIVWHNNATGENEIWFQDGTEHAGTWALPSNPGPGWGLHGADDFNGDGKPDLFFHDRTTGQNSIWLMNDATRSFEAGTNSTDGSSSTTQVRRFNPTIQAMATAMPSTDWMPAMVGDMNGDGSPDIVWRNTVTGENSVWLMYGTAVQQTVALPTRSDPNWQVGGGGSTNAGNSGGGTDPRTATAITIAADPAPLNTASAVTATLKAGSNPVAQRQIAFLLNGTEVSRLITDADGAATAALSVTGLAAGTYANAITVRFDGDNAYAGSSASANLVVLGTTPEVTWDNPSSIVYGTPLSAVQLNATANVPGTFVYTPPAGTILNAGYQTLAVTFTPADATVAPITRNAVLVVNPAPSSVSWAKPAPIAYGVPLSDIQLNATSSLTGEFTYDPEPGTLLPVGSGQTLRVTFAPENPNYASSSATTTIDVTKGEQIIRWTDPAPIGVGDALGGAQLNAKVITSGSAPAGALTYDPPAGTVLPEGTHALKVSAAATDFYNAAEASVDVVVTRSVPSIQWSNPVPIVYGTALSATQLNATAGVPGTFTYNPPAGTILNAGFEHLEVLFTPADSRYQEASATVVLEIRKAKPVVTWSTPAPIVYGVPLSAAQLNASCNVPGELTYTPKAGAILDAGTRELTVDFLPFDIRNYELVTAKVNLDVAKAPQVITWANPAPIVYGTALSPTQLNASVQVVGPASAGELTYAPPAGTVLQAGAAQELTVIAAATPNYNAASAAVRIDVLKATPVISWPQPAPIIYKTPLGAQQLDATANVPGTFDYTPPAGTLFEAGTYTLTAHFTPSDARNYNEASQTTTLEVRRANPVLSWSRPAGIVYGTALSATQLNASADVAGSFVYTPPSGTILNAGDRQTLTAHFTPADTRNYNEGDLSTTIDVAKAPQKIVWNAPAPIVYGTPLSATQLNATVEVVGPALAGALTYTPAAGTVLNAGLGQTLSVAVAETANYLPNSATTTMDVKRAPLSLTVDAKTKLYGSAVPPLTGVLTGVVNGDPISPSYATTATQQSVTGIYPITATLLDPNHRLPNYDVTITPSTLTVNPAPLLIAAVPASKQYSDPLPVLQATYTGLVLGETPAVLSGALSIQTTAEKLSAPGTYPITIGGLTSTNYAITYAGAIFTVTPEDARVVIISPLAVAAVTSGSTTVMLAAAVQDISATADANGDVDPGDIRKASLTFVDRASNTTLCVAPIDLVTASDQRTGIATCTFSRNFGTSLPLSLTVGARVGAYYTRDAASDDVVLSIATPTTDSVTGSGSVTVATAAGVHAPPLGGSVKVDLNPQYDQDGALKGKLDLTFSRVEQGIVHQYAISTSLSALAVRRTEAGGVAAITALATLRDVTKSNDPIVVFENAPMVVTATDAGEASVNDSVSVIVFSKTGGVLLATGWNGIRAVDQKLQNGNIQVHYGK